MVKKEIIKRFRKQGISVSYSGKTKTFHLKHNFGKHYQSLLINDVEGLGFKVTQNL